MVILGKTVRKTACNDVERHMLLLDGGIGHIAFSHVFCFFCSHFPMAQMVIQPSDAQILCAKDMSEKKMTINEDRYHGWRFQPHVFSYGHEFCFLDGIIHSLDFLSTYNW